MEGMQRPVAVQSPSATLIPTAEASSRLTGRFAALAAPALVAAAALAWTAIRGIDHRFISFSDGVYMYAASVAAADGAHSLYNVVALSLPPGPVLATTALWKLSPHVETVRLALALIGVLIALLTYVVARRLFTLGEWPAALASVIALTGPVHAQFIGVEGEALLTPLALGLALAVSSRHRWISTLLLGLGFFFKLTWLPFFIAGVVAIALRAGKRAALTSALGGILVGAALYAIALRVFGWSAHELFAQLVLGQSHSGFQVDLIAGLVPLVVLLWWPLLLPGRIGIQAADRTGLLFLAAGGISTLYMLKEGTFFNVLDPLEPFLAIAAVAGGMTLWQRQRWRARALVVACAVGAALHVGSVSSAGLSHALPFPLGAALVNVDNEPAVDRVAAAVAAHSRPGQAVLVSPFFALVAERREVAQAADWFILRSLQSYCDGHPGRTRHCTDWDRVKQLARNGRVAVVGVHRNVAEDFDTAFRKDTGVASMHPVLTIKAPPIETTIYSR
jgi:hypothetical protein